MSDVKYLVVFVAVLSFVECRCTSKGEEDYRPLFENFVYDLLSTVNKPDWPAAELILSLLGNLLVMNYFILFTDLLVLVQLPFLSI